MSWTAHSDIKPIMKSNVKEAASAVLENRYDRILREYGPALRRVASSYESDAGKREDLAQEIAVAIWLALPRFRGECSERTFVYRIAHNRGLTHAWRRGPSMSAIEEASHVPSSMPSPEALASVRERHERLAAALRTLPLLYREVLTLTLEELSHAEIAEVLGISESNVAVRLNRARKALREALGGSK